YIERLRDPEVRSFNRGLNGVDEDDSGQVDQARTLEEHVVAAEKELGIPLPPSYRRLVTTTDPKDKEYGLYWVRVNGLDTYSGDNVWYNRSPHSPLPPFLIAVLSADDGDDYCFDTRRADKRREYPIVRFDHERHNEDSTDFEAVAEGLGEFLLQSSGGE